jgi:hypothetical protein
VSIEVRPSARGVATIYDKEMVLYIASLMAAKIGAGMAISQDFTFTAHDLFSVTGANHSARPITVWPMRWNGFRVHRSAPISRRGGRTRKASSPGCRKRACNTRALASAKSG